ncbi:AraC family transcriptional regulator [Flavobacterium sp. KACC 22761]|uniref:AraC family transcriptional regulator n=1 Tax=Flavobacterium sp. KACC 22761 TaxID=3092665 RepID=UPI002A74F766|nr:AraC family transcriptional regulator [Flavobacterium sp. KACC 22761]WPO78473.1 AraC family transcriptional regulator [Flavobacterium sp. KACC 22761]
MKKIYHYYSLTPEWQQQFAIQTGSNILNDNIILFPKNIGTGHSYFTQITPAISVCFIDLLLENPIKLCRVSSDNEIFIFHYDLSEHVNFIKINNVDYEIGSYHKLDLGIIDNQIESSFKPALKERTFALRILVHKKLLHDFISMYPHIKYKGEANTKTDESFYHYGHIDSNSTLLLKSLKTKSIYDLSFDSYLKGISLKLLGNFFGKLYELGDDKYALTNSENEAILKTRAYLLSNLYGPFPSLIFLAAMAGMSESKYKTAFKKSLSTTPNAFFIQEKMNLARKLLRSGEYNNMTEVMYELNYSKLSYFSTKYFELFKCKPIKDFVKKKR